MRPFHSARQAAAFSLRVPSNPAAAAAADCCRAAAAARAALDAVMTPTYLLIVYVPPADTPNDSRCPTVWEFLLLTRVSVTAPVFALRFTVLASPAMMPVPSVRMVSQSRCAAASK